MRRLTADGNALEVLPRVGRMMAKLYAAAGNRAAAAGWFERSARVLAASANACARTEVLDDYADVLLDAAARPRASRPDPRARMACLHPPVARLTFHPRAATRLDTPDSAGRSPLDAIKRSAALIDLSASPQCVGHELHALLDQCSAVRHVAVVSMPADARPDLLVFWGDYRAAPKLLARADGLERIPLGRWRQHPVEFVADEGYHGNQTMAGLATRRL